MIVGDHVAYRLLVGCVLWVGDAHPRVTEGLKALVHCWVSGAAQVCVSLLGPCRELAAVVCWFVWGLCCVRTV